MVNEEMFVSRLMVKETEEEFVVKINSPRSTQRLVSDVCIFGLRSETMHQIAKDPELHAEPEIVTSLFNLFDAPSNQMTASYLFPNGVNLKKIRK